jgi:hypothetical protein
MPFLPDEQTTDKLLKHLSIDLFQQFDAGLRQLIEAKPLDREAVIQWFHSTYPQEL